MPHDIQPFINGLVETISIHGMEDIRETACHTLIAYPTTVTTNAVIAMYRSSTEYFAHEVGMHRAERPLNYQFVRCGTANCPSEDRPGNIIGELQDLEAARIRCKACKWKLRFVKLNAQPFIKPLHKTKAPLLFYREFPSPPGLHAMFLQDNHYSIE